MGGLVSKTLLRDPGDGLIRKASGRSWEEIKPKCTPEQRKILEEVAIYESVPFVRRMVFLAVPHRGAGMAQYFQVRMIARWITLPAGLVRNATDVMRNFVRRRNIPDGLEVDIKTGLEELSPKDKTLRAIHEIPLRADVPCHSIIGNREKATPGDLQEVVKAQRIVPPCDASFRTDSEGGMILSACDDPSHRQGREGETDVRNGNDNDGRVVKKKTNGGIFTLTAIAITCALIFLTGYIAGGGCQHKGHVRSQSTSRVAHDSEEYDDR